MMGFHLQLFGKILLALFAVSLISAYIFTIISVRQLVKSQHRTVLVLNHIIEGLEMERMGDSVQH